MDRLTFLVLVEHDPRAIVTYHGVTHDVHYHAACFAMHVRTDAMMKTCLAPPHSTLCRSVACVPNARCLTMDALTLTLLAEQTPEKTVNYIGTVHGQYSMWPMHAGCALAWSTFFGRVDAIDHRLESLSLPGHPPNSICWYCESPDYDGEIHWTV